MVKYIKPRAHIASFVLLAMANDLVTNPVELHLNLDPYEYTNPCQKTSQKQNMSPREACCTNLELTHISLFS